LQAPQVSSNFGPAGHSPRPSGYILAGSCAHHEPGQRFCSGGTICNAKYIAGTSVNRKVRARRTATDMQGVLHAYKQPPPLLLALRNNQKNVILKQWQRTPSVSYTRSAGRFLAASSPKCNPMKTLPPPMEPPNGTISNCSSTVAWDYLNHHVSANVLTG
jgi:hypothetical protein